MRRALVLVLVLAACGSTTPASTTPPPPPSSPKLCAIEPRACEDPSQAWVLKDNTCDQWRTEMQGRCLSAAEPIATGDASAWTKSFSRVVVYRGSPDNWKLFESGAAFAEAVKAGGGPRSFLELDPASPLEASLVRDCRNCPRAFVAVKATTGGKKVDFMIDGDRLEVFVGQN
jgi:hypothetical protein